MFRVNTLLAHHDPSSFNLLVPVFLYALSSNTLKFRKPREACLPFLSLRVRKRQVRRFDFHAWLIHCSLVVPFCNVSNSAAALETPFEASKASLAILVAIVRTLAL